MLSRWRRDRRPTSTAPTTCARLRPGRDRSPQLLPRRLYADQQHVRREVPDHRGQGEEARRHGRGAQGLLRRPRPRRRADHRGKRPRSASSSRSPSRTPFRCAPARSSSRSAIVRDSFPSSSISRPRLSRSSRPRTARPTHRTSPCSSASSIAEQVVRKVSQHYEIRGSSRQPSAPNRETCFSIASRSCRRRLLDGDRRLRCAVRQVERPPLDGGSAALRRDTLRVSSLVVVKRGEKVPEKERRADNPLLVKDVALSPNLGDPSARRQRNCGFYFAVYPGGGTGPE